ncbi:hypothetical protein HDU91_005562, partial [Kappamyces sp. JEL0680]
ARKTRQRQQRQPLQREPGSNDTLAGTPNGRPEASLNHRHRRPEEFPGEFFPAGPQNQPSNRNSFPVNAPPRQAVNRHSQQIPQQYNAQAPAQQALPVLQQPPQQQPQQQPPPRQQPVRYSQAPLPQSQLSGYVDSTNAYSQETPVYQQYTQMPYPQQYSTLAVSKELPAPPGSSASAKGWPDHSNGGRPTAASQKSSQSSLGSGRARTQTKDQPNIVQI